MVALDPVPRHRLRNDTELERSTHDISVIALIRAARLLSMAGGRPAAASQARRLESIHSGDPHGKEARGKESFIKGKQGFQA